MTDVLPSRDTNERRSQSLPAAVIQRQLKNKAPEDVLESPQAPPTVPAWCERAKLLTALRRQSVAEVDAYFNPSAIVNPALEQILVISPRTRRKFRARAESGDYAHLLSDVAASRSRRRRSRDTLLKQSLALRTAHTAPWSIDDFEIGQLLGSGTFSSVFVAREKESGYVVVLKVIPKHTLKKYHAERSLRNELEIQSHLDHPNIVRLFGYFDDWENVYLILEFCLHGDIFNEARRRIVDERLAAAYVRQVAGALHYMHTRKCIHRDLKLENIYLSHDGMLKVGDFGWSCHTLSDRGEKVVGTINYCAPEMLSEPYYDHKVDNWALGVLLFELLTGESPFYGSYEEIEDAVVLCDYSIPPCVPPGAQALIRALLQKDPAQRLELSALPAHPWVVAQSQVRPLAELCLLAISRAMVRGHDFRLAGAEPALRSQINAYRYQLGIGAPVRK